MFMEKYLQKTVTTTPWVRATWTWAAGCMIPEQPGTQLLTPSAGQDHWSFKRAWWITACAECLFCLKTYLKYPAEHAKCYQAAPACKKFNAGRPLLRFSLGSTSSQKEKHQPLPCQDHSLRFLSVASVSGILNCHCSLSARTRTLRFGWSKLKSITQLTQENNPLNSKMTFKVLLLHRHAQNTHIAPQLKTLSLLLCNCLGVLPYLKVNSDDNRISHCRAP